MSLFPSRRPSLRALAISAITLIVFVSASWWATSQQAINATFPSQRAGEALIGDKVEIKPDATTIVVNSTADVANATDGFCTLREAITAANSNTASGAAAGECAAGTNTGSDTIDLTGISGTVDLTSALPNLSSDLIINGPGAASLTVRRSTAGGTPSFRIFTIDSNRTVDISGLTASNGLTASGNLNGGGISNAGTLTLTNCTVSNNLTGGGGVGGGIYTSGTLTLTNTTVSGNVTGQGGNGGGLYMQGGALTLTNSSVNNNTTGQGQAGGAAGYGGGIFISQTTTPVSIVNSTISNNKTGPGGMVTGQGGGIFNGGALNITNSTIDSNQTASGFSNGDGGGICNVSNLTVTNSSITNNKASSSGGGVYSPPNAGPMTIIGTTISGNQAASGGGVSPSFTTTILNCLIWKNVAVTGGGIWTVSSSIKVADTTITENASTGTGGGINFSGPLNLTNVTITNNRSDSDNSGGETGGGISRNAGSVTLKNSIVAGNFRGTGTTPDDINNGANPSSSFNLIGTGGAAGLTNGVNNNQVGVADARLKPLAANGGPTMTCALLSDSPALDAGDNCVTDATHCGDPNIPQLTTDQRGAGFNRAVDGPDANTTVTVDIGAYETQTPLSGLADTGTNEDTQLVVAFDGGDTTTINSVTATSSNATLVPNNAANLAAAINGTTGTVTINPAANESGQANITVTVNRTGGSESKTFAVTVKPVNDAPSFVKGADQVVNEDAGPQSVNNWATSISAGAPDESSQTLTFQITNNTNATLFSAAPAISPAGTLTYTTASNANGSATITVNLKDNGGTSDGGGDTSPSQTFVITVNPVNDPPSFTKGPDQTFNEDSGTHQASGWATNLSSGPGNESGQTLTFQIANTNPSLFSVQPFISPAGALSFTSAVHANGSATVTVALKDNGGTANGGNDTSAAQMFTITINSVNDAPSFTKGADQTVSNNSGLQTVANWATSVSAGPSNESTQTLSFITTAISDPTLFAVMPAVSSTGTLAYQPAANRGGTATVTIQLVDNGGTANGGVDSSVTQSFSITVTPIGGSINFSPATASTTEGSGSVAVTVKRTGDLSQAVTVDYATSGDNNLPCSSPGGIATPKCDFSTALGTLVFAAGDDTKTITIQLSQDSYVEGPENFTVSLLNATGFAAIGTAPTVTVTIADDNTEPPANVIDDAGNFVRQHYHDFLNREPDQAGLDFWTSQITSCGSDTACTEVKRVNVSAAFFLSIEFQQTGYLVERMYKVAYGDVTGTSTLGGSHQIMVPGVRYSEFVRDTQRIARDVVVLSPGWEQVLENNKQAYAVEFVQTTRFSGALPTTLTPAAFVDRLNQNAGNVLSVSERASAINSFGGAADTSNLPVRAQVLRQVVEDQDLYNSEIRRAFVLTEYFGYLRRNPNDSPELTLDFSGYEFWLNKLNQFNGNFINAEMVKAFISSGEYRQRFGP